MRGVGESTHAITAHRAYAARSHSSMALDLALNQH